jgi:hypothetical protein
VNEGVRDISSLVQRIREVELDDAVPRVQLLGTAERGNPWIISRTIVIG